MMASATDSACSVVASLLLPKSAHPGVLDVREADCRICRDRWPAKNSYERRVEVRFVGVVPISWS